MLLSETTQISKGDNVLDAATLTFMVLFGEMHLFFTSVEKAYLAQTEPIFTLIQLSCRNIPLKTNSILIGKQFARC
jgi:hypothetical protein